MTASEQADAYKVSVLMFAVGERRYGVPLAAVREVVDIDGLEPIEGQSEDYIGVMVLRHEPIALVSVRSNFQDIAGSLRICVVLHQDDMVVGVAVENIVGIRELRPSRSMHGLVVGDHTRHAYLDDDGSLVHAVDIERWINARIEPPLLSDLRDEPPALVETGTDLVEDRSTYLALAIEDRRFALHSMIVDRAVDGVRAIPLPNRPGARLDSVIEVSGNILPVLRLCDLAMDRQNIFVVVSFAGQKWAIAAEHVLGIVHDEQGPTDAIEETAGSVIRAREEFFEVVDLEAVVATQVPDFVSEARDGG